MKMNRKEAIAQVIVRILAKKQIHCGPDITNILEVSEKFVGLPVPTRGMPYSTIQGRLRKVYSHLTGIEDTFSVDEIVEDKPKPEKLARQSQIDRFYSSYDWKQLRYTVIKKYKGRCMACNRSDLPLHVDHIKPLRKYWSLRLDINNLQILCQDCNYGKGNWDEHDWRDKPNTNLENDFIECLSSWHFWDDLSANLQHELVNDLIRVAAIQEIQNEDCG